MKNQNYITNIIILFITVFSIVIAAFLWPIINLPYSNPENVVGVLSLIKYSPLNDTLRYIVFVGIPILSFFFSLLFFKKEKLIKIKTFFMFEKNDTIYKHDVEKIIYILYFFFVILIFIEFLSNDLPLAKLDYLHDGDYLTAAYNYSITNKIWISSFSPHGASMILYPNIMWKIFGIESIGSYRLLTSFLIIFVKILSIHFAYQLTKIVLLNSFYKSIFFICFSFIILSMSNFGILDRSYDLISFRDLYMLLFLIVSFNIIALKKNNYFNIFLISIIPSVTILLHTDIGIYLYFSLLFYFLYFYLSKDNKRSLFIISTILFFWIVCIIFFGTGELTVFIKNVISISSSIGFTHGLVYPDPFFDIGELKHASRATKGLLLQLIAGLIIVYKVIINNGDYKNNNKFFFIFILLLSFIFYHTALVRSDSYHIRMSCDLPIIIIVFFTLDYLLFRFQNFFKYKVKKNIKSFFTYVSLFVIIIFSFWLKIDYSNMINFNERYKKFVNLEDEYFMNNGTKDLIDYMKVESLNDSCVQNFTYELAIPYYLKKPSCTPYYSSFLAGSISLQKNYISKLKESNPSFIVYRSDKFIIDGIDIHERLINVNLYIKNNYYLHKKINRFLIYKKKI